MGSKVRGVRPIEFQRKISSLCWGGKSKNFAFERDVERRNTHEKISCHFMNLKQRETKMRQTKGKKEEGSNNWRYLS